MSHDNTSLIYAVKKIKRKVKETLWVSGGGGTPGLVGGFDMQEVLTHCGHTRNLRSTAPWSGLTVSAGTEASDPPVIFLWRPDWSCWFMLQAVITVI